jgi:RNA polymerase II subunit A small phosphatase-like protein
MDIDKNKHCLVLDLDETLVHSSFKPVPNADYVLPVEIEGESIRMHVSVQCRGFSRSHPFLPPLLSILSPSPAGTTHYVYVLKRPGCEEFLAAVGERYEVVLFTASLAKYADPLLDLLDTGNVIRSRLFREACVFHEGSYVKDMSLLGRSPANTIIVDNSPASYLFQPENALPCDSFIDDMADTELYSLADFLIRIAGVADVRQALQQWTKGAWQGGYDLPYVHQEGVENGAQNAGEIVLGDTDAVPRDLDPVDVRTPAQRLKSSEEALDSSRPPLSPTNRKMGQRSAR